MGSQTSIHPQDKDHQNEAKAQKELRTDENRVILTADKGVVLVVLQRTKYINKAQELLEDGGT